MIAIADSYTGQYASKTAFMQALADRVNIELKQRGFSGATIDDVRWIEEDGKPPIGAVQASPGEEWLNAARLRAWLLDKRAADLRREASA